MLDGEWDSEKYSGGCKKAINNAQSICLKSHRYTPKVT